ncbi:hypothetical protein G5B35_15270 [Parapusillimonas sp. SGNA-6]|nr:hypothetical protein [Parapusillimonas sp. SGNA-6]
MTEHQFPQGRRLKPLRKGPLTSSHLVRWCAAQQNWDKIHYDADYARNIAGLKERVINGGLKQHYLVQMLQENLADNITISRLKYDFLSPDFVNESLEVRGHISGSGIIDGQWVLQMALEVWNLDQEKVSTTAKAHVVLPVQSDIANTLDPDFLPAKLDETIKPADEQVPRQIKDRIGTVFESAESDYPVDLSRLRLFCDAIGGMPAIHYSPAAARRAGHDNVLAPHLFPIHGIEAPPDSLSLSEEPEALGREAMSEIGRNFGRMFGIPNSGMVNGGNDVEFHSFLQLGERVRADSTLLEARIKQGRVGGSMLIVTALNRYSTTSDRLLLRERQSIIYRNFQ